ncbi:MAG: acyltransferase [Mesorhizobium sp.]|uniref:acyltransferase n=1 Tax=Mesorhizobium sp. TaxID=1871066 RepID=UPI000FE5E779|nr:acyltransferase [Mesorhizobium sp.]RWK61778.1 MAG: acyltransferase [Mesorhizobium sp.]RWM47703.1 MAG: acyltransferase [Mesorhizobium sp.]RWN02435.1 MAG: acyltransferase [Mesorhizobium sp.]
MSPVTYLLRCIRFAASAPRRISDRLAMRAKLRRCKAGSGTRLWPQSRISNHRAAADIQIGNDTKVLGELLTFGHGGRITIGDHCYIGENTRIWSCETITIGNRVLISHGVNIHDNVSHSMSAERRHQHFLAIFSTGHSKEDPDIASAVVVIEDDAWIGFNASVLKGVKIGRGAVVGACSVVTKDVLPYEVVVGNPAKPIGTSKA